MEWYENEDHVGYDLAGEKIMKTLKESEIDNLLQSRDNPDAWRTIKDHKNQREIVLTDADLEVIRRIRHHMWPSKQTDVTEMIEFDNPDGKIHPVHGLHPSKARFRPSYNMIRKIRKIRALIREGKIRPPPPPKPEVWDLWQDEHQERKRAPPQLPAPKMHLPGHIESYNPPAEYLFSEEQKQSWEEQEEDERRVPFIPQKFDCLRHVPVYDNFILERYKRCLDLYLVPRAIRKRMNVDPESLLPKLPNPKDLRPFPTRIAVSYTGHTGLVRSISVDSSGQWIATGSGDQTLRIWEVSSGRQFVCVNFDGPVTAVSWSPQYPILAVASNETLYFMSPDLEPPVLPEQESDEKKLPEEDAEDDRESVKKTKKERPLPTLAEMLTFPKKVLEEQEEEDPDTVANEGAKARATRWHPVPEDDRLHKLGFRIMIKTDQDVQHFAWHARGGYCAAISPRAIAPSNQCIIHALHKKKSVRPFKRIKGGGRITDCAFHPSKPYFFAATLRSVKMYDLKMQTGIKSLRSGAKWIATVSVHPGGDHVLVGSYDRKLLWFDLDLGVKPYKTFKYHDKAVRRVHFHPGKYPLLAACSDDATVSILHGRVYSDLMKNPTIVPVKRLRGHLVHESLGVLDCQWHPTQAWLFTAGADHNVFMWV